MDDFRPGDILACYGTDRASRSITRWTSWSPSAWRVHLPSQLRRGPSHVAIVAEQSAEVAQPILIESTTFCRHPCLIRKQVVSGCQAHWPEQRIADYVAEGGYVDLYRIRPELFRLFEPRIREFSEFLRGFVKAGVGYDMAGAIVSGGILSRWLLASPDLHKMFCSELLARGLMAFSMLNYDVPGRFYPGRLLRDLVSTAVYAHECRYDAETFPLTDPPAILQLPPERSEAA